MVCTQGTEPLALKVPAAETGQSLSKSEGLPKQASAFRPG